LARTRERARTVVRHAQEAFAFAQPHERFGARFARDGPQAGSGTAGEDHGNEHLVRMIQYFIGLPSLMQAHSHSALRQYLWVFVVAAVSLAIYLPGLGNQLVFDDSFLTENDLLAPYRSLGLRARVLSYGSFVWLQSLLGDGW